MEHSCTVCGKSFDTNRSHARYCSSTCRGRALRSRKASGDDVVVAIKTRPAAASEQPAAPDLVHVVTRQLTDAGKLDTYLGQQALIAAGWVVQSRLDTGSAKAALSKELGRLMSIALADVKPELDMLDGIVGEVVQMRSRRRG